MGLKGAEPGGAAPWVREGIRQGDVGLVLKEEEEEDEVWR